MAGPSSTRSRGCAGSCRSRRRARAGCPCGSRRSSCSGCWRGRSPPIRRHSAARSRIKGELAAVGEAVAEGVDSARARGLDPLSMRAVALDSEAGGNLLEVLPLPHAFSYSQFSTYEDCPLRYAFQAVYRIPSSRAVAAFSFGTSAHAAFEAFTEGAPRAPGAGRAAADAHGSRAAVPRRVAHRQVRRPDDRGDLPAPGRDAARQLLRGRARGPRRGAPRGARLPADDRARRWFAAVRDRGPDRPDRPPPERRDRGHRLQDRPRCRRRRT